MIQDTRVYPILPGYDFLDADTMHGNADKHGLIGRLGSSLEALNTRIARLARALHVPLNDPTAVAVLMAMHQAPTVVRERRKGRLDLAQVEVSFELRQVRQHEELRGLLVLRYHMEAASVNDNGPLVTWEVMAQVEAHLVRRGFKPGADGLGLDSFFNVT
jgi:hypothetical protein